MLYFLLKPIVKTALRLYFGRIVTHGLEHIDNEQPTIILANHTASFMDALIAACFIRRRIHFFTRGDVFRYPLLNKIMRSLGMLPIYRFSEGRDKFHLNDQSNEEALKILAKGGAVLIFCEGASDISKILKPLKKGPFRLAVNAASSLNTAPVLVPMGINYVTPTHAFGDVFLNAASGIRVDKYHGISETEFNRSTTELMRQTATEISPLVWHIAPSENIPLFEDLLQLLSSTHRTYSFYQSQNLFRNLLQSDPIVIARLNNLRSDQKAWNNLLAAFKAKYFAVPRFHEWLLILSGLPFALIGIAGNYLPMAIAKQMKKRTVKDPDFEAPVFVAIAVIACLIYYALAIVLLSGKLMIPAFILVAIVAACGWFYVEFYRNVFLKILDWFRYTSKKEERAEEKEFWDLGRDLEQIILKAVTG